ncbi:MAG TPA: class II fructose-bisphosphatase [Acidimicrobiales bacterium]|nr:class II fructose-bisphosphatase [Acidimicrobiales bacterium]
MRLMLETVDMDGVVVIGEGEKDQAPMLFNGEHVGSGRGPQVDVAVDPLEGTELTANGQPNALAVLAVAERGTIHFPTTFYMDKLAVGPRVGDVVSLDADVDENVARVADALKKSRRDVTVVVLDRPRNAGLIDELRQAGARVNLVPHGDTAPAIAAARGGSGVDMVMGIGGATEAILAAAALKAMGGAIQVRPWPRDEVERAALDAAGVDPQVILSTTDLVGGEDVFVAATGVTTGPLLSGVGYFDDGAATESLVVRSRSGTARWVRAEHQLDKLTAFTGRAYR